MSRSVSIFSVVVVMTVTVLAIVAVAFAAQGEGGNSDHKITICHKGHVISVDKHAWWAHEKHGDAIIQENPEDTCGNGGALPEEPSEGATLTTDASNSGTQEDPATTVGQSINDVATLSEATSTTGTITFKLYGPFDPATDPSTDTCIDPDPNADPPVEGNLVTLPDTFNNVALVDANGRFTATSPDFTPTEAGRYQWVASYSGDDTNEPVTSECNAENEQSLVSGEAGTTATEQNMTLAAQIGGATNPADPATDTSNIEGTTQNDNTTLGTDSDDDLIGDSSANVLLGRDGSDFLDGGTDRDRMVGGRKYDFINGADGKPGDVLNGGNGTDYCVGDVGDEFNNCDGNVVQVGVRHH